MSKKTRLKLIAITHENYVRLKELGYASDSFNDVVTKLLNERKVEVRTKIE